MLTRLTEQQINNRFYFSYFWCRLYSSLRTNVKLTKVCIN